MGTWFHRRNIVSSLAICVLFLCVSSLSAGDWPQWRGPNRTGHATSEGLLKEWPKEGPPVRWQVDRVGIGYSSVSIVGERIFTQGDLNGVEHTICLSTRDGNLLWRVQPGPLAELLATRLDKEMQRLDTNKDGVVSELEALKGFGWRFNDHDRPVQNSNQTADTLAAVRSAALFSQLDKDGDASLSFAEGVAGRIDRFDNLDTRNETIDAKMLAAQRAKTLLKGLDKDGDKRISRDESRQTPVDRPFGRADIPAEGEKRGDQLLTEEEIYNYLLKYEPGKDGKITRQELTTYYAKHHPLGDGKLSRDELRSIYGGYRNGMGNGPRGTPTIEGDHVFVEGGNGDVSCLSTSTGKTVWHVNLNKDFGGGRPGWGYSESPLIEDDFLIVTPGGKQGTMVALNKYTGKLKWQSKEVTQGAHYASPVAATIGGVRQVVQFARSNVFGVQLSSGKLLWSYSSANNGTANCATPIIDGDHIFASSAYGTGGGLARIRQVDNKQVADEIYFEKRMANHHGGIIKVGDHMYGFGSGGLICMNFLTGEIAWRARSVGKGSLIYADGMLYLLGENHQVALAEATPEEYREHGRFTISSHGRPSWAHASIAGETLYIRDQESLTAYDISSQQ